MPSIISTFYSLIIFATCINALSIEPSSFNVGELDSRAVNLQAVSLRIEGLTHTIYEGPIISGPHNITTPSGGTHPCLGTNNNANPSPGATATSALDEAHRIFGFPYDGTYSPTFQDYFITSIGDSTQTATQFWGLLNNYQFAPVGGCQEETKTGDQVLWAFDAFSKTYFLRLTGPLTARKGVAYTVRVTDGTTGVPVADATVGGAQTAADGTAVITPTQVGLQRLKAERADSLRSNRLDVVVA